MDIVRVDREQWKEISSNAHAAVFGKIKPAKTERIDFALMGVEGDKVLGYMTCKERDADTVYWQFGGALEIERGTTKVWTGFKMLIDWHRERYKNVYTMIENKNSRMLRIAAKAGFRIVGIKTFKEEVLLEHYLYLREK